MSTGISTYFCSIELTPTQENQGEVIYKNKNEVKKTHHSMDGIHFVLLQWRLQTGSISAQ